MMNVLLPVSEFMAKDLITVAEGDELTVVKKIFDDHNIHHIPVVHFKEIKGMISKIPNKYISKILVVYPK